MKRPKNRANPKHSNKKNKRDPIAESSKPIAKKKLKKEKPKKPARNLNPRPFDLEATEAQLQQLKQEDDATSSKKTRKKIRRLEFIIKRYVQMKSTMESLTLPKNGESQGAQEPMEAMESEDEDKEPSAEEESDGEKETLKGIKRFVVFVGSLPKSVTEDDLRTHFQKVGGIKSIRLPEAKADRKKNFAFIELEDRSSFEKTLSMHHTMLNNKRINVSFTNPDGSNLDLKEIKSKNAKFNAMRKAGLLEGSVAEHKKRSFRRKKKRLAEAKAAAAVKV